jgi:hypothetical protein
MEQACRASELAGNVVALADEIDGARQIGRCGACLQPARDGVPGLAQRRADDPQSQIHVRPGPARGGQRIECELRPLPRDDRPEHERGRWLGWRNTITEPGAVDSRVDDDP